MNNALILCDGVKGDDPGAVRLNLNGQDTNLKATIQNLSHQLFKNLDDYLVDFIRIAVFLYGADGAVSRGRLLDVYAQKWVRKFSLPGWFDDLDSFIIFIHFSWISLVALLPRVFICLDLIVGFNLE